MLSLIAAGCSGWHSRSHDLRVSLDVPLPLLSLSVPRRLEELFSARDVAPEQLTLEVSEDDWLKGGDAVREDLTRLRMRGFGLAIGRFGTGYANANQFLNAPITEIKLAPALVRAAPDDPAAAAAIASCVALARELGLNTVADGIETPRHLEHAFRLGCDQVQGSLLAPLMPTEEFERWIGRPSPLASTITRRCGRHP